MARPCSSSLRGVLALCALTLCVLTLLLLPSESSGQLLTKKQQTCSALVQADFAHGAATLGHTLGACLKLAAQGKLAGTIEDCVTADENGKRAKVAAKTASDFDKKCGGDELPPYGVTNADVVTAAGIAKERALFQAVLGPDLDAATIPEAADKLAAKCQQAIVRGVTRCQNVSGAAFAKCARLGFKDKNAPIGDATALGACLGSDPDGGVAKQCDLRTETGSGRLQLDAIRQTLAKECAAVDLAATFPGCGAAPAEAVHACVLQTVRCRTCLALNLALGLNRDCDAFDDGIDNASCVATPVTIGQHQCVLDPLASHLRLDTASVGLDLELSGILGIDCGNVDALTGVASCTCTLATVDPILIPDVGFACLTPATGCPAGRIACDGGAGLDVALTATHALGACTDDGGCATACSTHCAATGADVLSSACESAPHANVCQCQCLANGGATGRTGGLRCSAGFGLTLETSPPCGDGDVLADLGTHCLPLTTEQLTAVITDADTIPMTELPPGGTTLTGAPIGCSALGSGATGGLGLVGAVELFDAPSAGDTALGFTAACL